MADNHLTVELLRAVHLGKVPAAELASASLGHLLETCPTCQGAVEAWRGAPATETDDHFPYEAILSRFEDEFPGGTASIARRRFRDHRGLPLADRLLADARSCLPERAGDSFALASLSRSLVQNRNITPQSISIYARAVTFEANALRVLGNLPESCEMLGVARAILGLSPDAIPSARALIDYFEGALERRLGNHRAAKRLYLGAIDQFSGLGDVHNQACGLISLATLQLEVADPQCAAETAERAILLITERDLGLDLLLMARQNLVAYRLDSGDIAQAEKTLAETETLSNECGGPIGKIRRQWIGGQLALARGRSDLAEQALLQVERAFLDAGLVFDASQAMKERAELYIEQGRHAQADEIVRKILLIFERLELYREVEECAKLLDRGSNPGALAVH